MKKIALILIVVLFAACKKERVKTKCNENLNCTLSFDAITVQFVNEDGEGVNVINFSAVNQRTKDTIHISGAAHWLVTQGTYVVVDDSSTKSLSETGDDIKVSGTNPATNQTKTASIKVAGGKCACHIRKVSGPEKIQFD